MVDRKMRHDIRRSWRHIQDCPQQFDSIYETIQKCHNVIMYPDFKEQFRKFVKQHH